MKIQDLIELLHHACLVALGDLLKRGMPEDTSTGILLKEALLRGGKCLAPPTLIRLDSSTSTRKSIQVGDLLYVVGPGHNPPQSETDLQVYSTCVENIREDPEAPTHPLIELSNDRPHLGFPRWIFRAYEVGINFHCSKSDALQAFAQQARQRHDAAMHIYDHTNAEIEWALTMAAQHKELKS